MNKTPLVIGSVVEALREFFTPSQPVPPLGGGTDIVHIAAGENVGLPILMDDACGDCAGPYLWIRLVRRFYTSEFPDEGESKNCAQPAIRIEAGIARCAPLDGDCATDEEEVAQVLWDDAWRIDRALCRGLNAAVKAGYAGQFVLEAGEPAGPSGLTIIWAQTAVAQL